MSERPRGLIVAAARSGAGKTTIASGLIRALARRGRSVQPFKCGPDYIDPAFHTAATGRPSFNLDTWAMSPGTLAGLVARHGASADLVVVEGVMGLFDGVAERGQTARGATADLAALTGWPVALVLDVSGQAETAAAIASGLARYRDDVEVAGVILNRAASARHVGMIAPGLERAGLKLFGALPSNAGFSLPERHLGLVQAVELPDIVHRLDILADTVEASLDLDAIEASARTARAGSIEAARGLLPPGQRIALAQDRAFSFMYPHLLESWRRAGAEILPFSPLADEAPDAAADAVWLPGGYPELHAGTLAAAGRFAAGMKALAAQSVPVHGECGGYMVLGQGLVDAGGTRHAMLGFLDVETSFARRRLHLGYRRARLVTNGVLGARGDEVAGHEFHYASIQSTGDAPLVECRDANGAAVPEAGAQRGSVSGTFFHAIDRWS
ncbi:cobyrinate a,c-diamide synthase [Reyranella sp. MMS21-HV4-11]|uniref:Hydrogenobyrinate a,c-diamide synthase n=1 Tax=Reyranella humidisoli TaxID=2849149 RepID=A0ABS6ID32_9HYPH|nr:cobyrinate a,c-diamide synthase [Reyranella sp. MMS21-HV4-11]MBU8872517.1 cobyrinate a,c-diamide synthase [Reyranella sp. MMS21-HV4-11]